MTATEKKIDQIVQKISSRSKPEKIIVFGSTAKGHRHAHSDIDLVVIRKSHLSSWKHHQQLDRLIDHTTPVDMLV